MTCHSTLFSDQESLSLKGTKRGLISWMPNFKPDANLNTIIEISGAGEGGGEERRGLKMELETALCVTYSLQSRHSFL